MNKELSNEMQDIIQRTMSSLSARNYENYFNHLMGQFFGGGMYYVANKKFEDIEIYLASPNDFYISKWQTLSYFRGYFPVETRIVFRNELPVGLITKEISGQFSGQTYVSTETQSFKSQVDALVWVCIQAIRGEQLV